MVEKMIEKKWLSIDIGYESPLSEKCGGKPAMQTVFEELFTKGAMDRWAVPGSTQLDAVIGDDDSWTAEVILKELNSAIQANGKNDLVALLKLRSLFPEVWAEQFHIAGPAPTAAPTPTGEPGTRCRLVAGKWVNSRSYELRGAMDSLWPKNADPKSAKVFATVNWRCWPPE